MKFLLIGLVLCVAPVLARAQNLSIDSFSRAKKHLRQVFAEDPMTLYSRCRYDDKDIDYSSCQYQPLKQNERARRVEWEHLVPAEAFGRAFEAWRQGHPDCVDGRGRAFRGRQCAAKVDPDYRRVEADMYNLFPEIGELNTRRSNYTIGAVAEGNDVVHTGSGKIAGRVFEPPDTVKGEVARVHLYMHAAYPQLHILSPQRQKLYEAWSATFPVSERECSRAARIKAIQGNINEVVRELCSASG